MKQIYINLTSLLNAIIFFMFIPFLSNFLITKIGIIPVSIIMPFNGIINFLTSISFGNMADVLGKYQTFVKLMPWRILLWFILVISMFNSWYILVALLFVYDAFFSVIINGTMGSYLYEIAQNEDEIKKFNTTNYIMFNIGVFVGPLIGGIFFEHYNKYILLFNLASLIIQYVLFKKLFLKEGKKGQINLKHNLQLTKTLIRNKFNASYYFMLCVMAVCWVGVYDSVMPTYFIQKHQSLSFFNINVKTYELVSLTLLINGILLIAITNIINYLLKPTDMWKKYLIIIVLLFIANLGFFNVSPLMVIITIIIISFAEVIMPVAQTQVIYRISNQKNRAQYLTFFGSSTMIGVSLSNIFNVLIINFDMKIVALVLLLCIIITLVTFFKLKRFYREDNTQSS